MISVLWLIDQIIGLYVLVVFVSIVLSWLIAFDVINLRNRFAYALYDFCNRLTNPLLNPIRRVLPSLGGLDLSPMILVLFLLFLKQFIPEMAVRFHLV